MAQCRSASAGQSLSNDAEDLNCVARMDTRTDSSAGRSPGRGDRTSPAPLRSRAHHQSVHRLGRFGAMRCRPTRKRYLCHRLGRAPLPASDPASVKEADLGRRSPIGTRARAQSHSPRRPTARPAVRRLGLVLGQGVGDDRVGVAVPHAVVVLQHAHQFCMLGRTARADERLPVGDRMTVFLLDRGKIRRGAFDGLFSHAELEHRERPGSR